jgi:hypothetical protein
MPRCLHFVSYRPLEWHYYNLSFAKIFKYIVNALLREIKRGISFISHIHHLKIVNFSLYKGIGSISPDL